MTTAIPARPSGNGRSRAAVDWVDRAGSVAAQLLEGAVQRDRLARPPVEEIALLKESGLVTLLGPTEHGGAGKASDWTTITQVIRVIASADGSIANILGWHYAYFWLFTALATPEQRERWEADATRNQWLFAGIVNLRDEPLRAVPDGDAHLRVSGRKSFNTGVPVADQVFLHAALDGGDAFFGIVGADSPGIELSDDWDTLGQRTTVSGGAQTTDVRLAWADVLGVADGAFQPKIANITPGLISQLLMANFYLGLAQGSLASAVQYTRTNSRSWLHSPYERATDEPHVVDGYGELQSRLLAVEALADRAAAELTGALSDLDSFTEERRGELAALIAATKTVAAEFGLDSASKVFEFTGARATAREVGLDRYWRDLRTQSLHDPIGYKRRQVGAFLLRGEAPGPYDWYA
jgi:alkylation response protein AidB-like acyl-CoA dehydrogenase